MKLERKQYCMHNLLSMVMEKLIIVFPHEKEEDLMADFTQSDTYRKLLDEKTRLWAEGPDYILNLYYEEKAKALSKQKNK